MGSLAAMLLTLGIIFLLLSWILLVITAAKDDYGWLLFTVLLPPVAYLYGLFAWSKAKDAILLAALGWLMLFLQTAA